MTADPRIERALPRILEDLGAGRDIGYADDILLEVRSTAQRPAWSFPQRWRLSAAAVVPVVAGSRMPRRAMALVVLLILGLVAGVVVVGSRPVRLPPLTGLAANGVIAYAFAGDIYVGDPVTGETTGIVVGPTDDRSPIFSPDGTRIAFVRRRETADLPVGAGDPFGNSQLAGGSDIVVARPDGSDLRVITTEPLVGLELRGWTQDSASVEANHFSYTGGDWEYQSWTFDATGKAEPRAPDPRAMTSEAMAGFEVPSPDGDRLLELGDPTTTPIDPTADGWSQPPQRFHSITVRDRDGGHAKVLVERGRLNGLVQPAREVGLAESGPFVTGANWSLDGSIITFQVGVDYALPCGPTAIDLLSPRVGAPLPCIEWRVFVMNADGSDLRRAATHASAAGTDGFTTEGYPSWSPDGSKIAFDRWLTSESGETDCCSVVAVDLATGAEREIDARAIGYDYIGSQAGADTWSWSPDGTSLLFYDYGRDRLVTVDVATGQETELPWKVGLRPNWQRLAP